MIFERISNDIPPQKKILNMVITILLHLSTYTALIYSKNSLFSLKSVLCKPHKAAYHIIQENVTKLMTSNYFGQYTQDLLLHISSVIQSDVMLHAFS